MVIKDAPKYISTRELADMLNISTCCLGKYRSCGMPHIKMTPRLIRYELAKIEAWLGKKSYGGESN